MKQLVRIRPPKCLDNNCRIAVKRKKIYYEDLRYRSNNKIKPRWNMLDIKYCSVAKCEVSSIRSKLLKMSNNECAYCGKKITNSKESTNKMEVDHYLPSTNFEYIAYCWENYLPSCHNCNHIVKNQYTPPSLKNLTIIEDIIENEYQYDYIYDKEFILNTLSNDRIIDPSFDNVEVHLEFVPESYGYINKSKIGETTNDKFFRREEFEDILERISKVTLEFVKNNCDIDALVKINEMIKIDGYEYYYKQYYEFWTYYKHIGIDLEAMSKSLKRNN